MDLALRLGFFSARLEPRIFSEAKESGATLNWVRRFPRPVGSSWLRVFPGRPRFELAKCWLESLFQPGPPRPGTKSQTKPKSRLRLRT